MEIFIASDEELDFSPQHDRSHGNSRYSTGPRSPDGKLSSSQNATKHGCRAKTLILPGESQDDFDDLYDRWMSAYQPEDGAAIELVEEFVLNKWYLQRTLRRYEEVEQELAQIPFPSWTDEQHKKHQLATRYKTAAERTVSRAMRDVEAWKKSCHEREKQAHDAEKELFGAYCKISNLQFKHEAQILKLIEDAKARNLDISGPVAAMDSTQKKFRATLNRIEKQIEDRNTPASRSKTLFQGQYHPKKLRKIPVLDQWVEIAVKDGKTVTTLYPSNEKLIREGQIMLPPPEMVYRRLNFVNGVPPEYYWTTRDEETRTYGGMGIQRMTVDTWLDVIEREKVDPESHIGPCGGNLPRPQERGGCDCPVCSHNRAILENDPLDPLTDPLG